MCLSNEMATRSDLIVSNDSIINFLDSIGVNRHNVRVYVTDLFTKSPITFSQSALSIIFYILDVSTLVPGSLTLFHPELVFRNVLEAYRCVISCYLNEGSILSITGQILQGYTWKSKLEDSLSTHCKLGMIHSTMTNNRFNFTDLVNNFVSNIFKDTYFQVQMLTILVISTEEIIFHYILGDVFTPGRYALKTVVGKPLKVNLLYSLNTNFEYSLFFLWVMRFKNSHIQMFNMIPIPAILFPIGLVVLSKFRNISVIGKSFIAAAVVSKIMHLKCHMSDEDMFDSFVSTGSKLVNSAGIIFKKLLSMVY